MVLLGGYPGEWEGEHPAAVIRGTGVEDVFLAGWRGHEDLPDGLNAADLTVLASVHEQFGQVIVEGMACGLPAIAVDAHGPATIVDAGEDRLARAGRRRDGAGGGDPRGGDLRWRAERRGRAAYGTPDCGTGGRRWPRWPGCTRRPWRSGHGGRSRPERAPRRSAEARPYRRPGAEQIPTRCGAPTARGTRAWW